MRAAVRGLPLLWVVFIGWVFLGTPREPHITSTLRSELAAAGASFEALAAGPTETAPGPLPSVIGVLMLGAALLACAAFGRWLRRKALDGALDPALELALDIALGLAVLAYLVMLLGLTGLLYVPVLALCPILLLVVGRREVRTLVALLQEARAPESRASRALLAAVVLLSVCALVRNLFPPTSAEWDSLVYHLTGPKLFLAEHRIVHVPHDHHLGFPFTMEMLYLLGLALQGWQLAKLFHLAMYLLCGLAIFGAVRDIGRAGRMGPLPKAPDVSALAAAACFLSVPATAWEASTAYIDLGLALYTLLGVILVGRFLGTGERGLLLLAGIMCGVAFAIKMTGLIVVLFAGGAMVYGALRDRSVAWVGRLRRGVTRAAVMCGIGIAIASPWYAKTTYHTGNPFFPFFYEVLGGRDWSQDRADEYKAEQQSHGVHQLARTLDTGPFARQRTLASRAVRSVLGAGDPPNAVGVLLAPILQVSAPDAFWEHPAPWSIVGPVFLGLLPLLVLRRPLPPEAWACTAYVCLGVVAWVHLSQLSRYLLPVLACGAVSVGYLLLPPTEARRGEVAVRAGAWALLLVCLLCFTLLAGARAVIALPGALGIWSTEDVASQTLESYAAFRYLNGNAGPGANVALYGEPRVLWLDVPHFFADRGHNMLIPYDELRGPDDLMAALSRLGATHVLVNPRYHPGVLEARTNDRISQMLTQLADSGRLVLVHGRPPRETMVFAISKEQAQGEKELKP